MKNTDVFISIVLPRSFEIVYKVCMHAIRECQYVSYRAMTRKVSITTVQSKTSHYCLANGMWMFCIPGYMPLYYDVSYQCCDCMLLYLRKKERSDSFV